MSKPIKLHPAYPRWDRADRARGTGAVRALRARLRGQQPTRPSLWYSVPEKAWELLEAFRYTTDRGFTIEVERGFLFDLASVPRIVWPLIAPFELSIAAPLVHDKLYEAKGRLGEDTYTRRDSDRIFREAMKREGVSRWRRVLAYQAVRRFGWIVWRRKRKDG